MYKCIVEFNVIYLSLLQQLNVMLYNLIVYTVRCNTIK